MELLYVVLGLLVLYLFMNKCGCRRVEGLAKGDCCDFGETRCDCDGWGVLPVAGWVTGNPECNEKGWGTCR
jgi:hypothetical protein